MIEKLNFKVQKLVQCEMNIYNLYELNNEINFSKVFKTYNGGVFKSKHYVPFSKHKLITIKNIDDHGFNTSTTSFLSSDKADPKYLLNVGDIILTMTGNIGRVGIVDENNCYLNQRVLKIDSQSKLYLYCYLRKYKNEIIILGKGTAQQNLSLDDLNNLIVKNDFESIKAFKKFDFIFDLILNIKCQIKKLKEIKSFLLTKYF